MSYVCGVCAVDMTETLRRALPEKIRSGIYGLRDLREGAEAVSIVRTCPNGHACRYVWKPFAGAEQRGVPVPPDELGELDQLTALFAPAAGARVVDRLATWLLGAAGLVATLAAGGLLTDWLELGERGERLLAFAVLGLGVSLTLAALARAPRVTRIDPDDTGSLRRKLRRGLIARFAALLLAVFAFAAALSLAAFATLADDPSKRPPTHIAYTLTMGGHLSARFAVADAEAFSPVSAAVASTSFEQTLRLPRARSIANEDGRAVLSLIVPDAWRVGTVTLVGNWRPHESRTLETQAVRVPLPARAIPDPAHRPSSTTNLETRPRPAR